MKEINNYVDDCVFCNLECWNETEDNPHYGDSNYLKFKDRCICNDCLEKIKNIDKGI